MIGRLLSYIQANSLSYFTLGSGCCVDEILNTEGCRYDLERFGCVRVQSPEAAELLFVNAMVNRNNADIIRSIYQRMKPKKFVLALGSCATSGGPFAGPDSTSTKESFIYKDIQEILPVDVFVPGCPPRPESIMHAIITLQDRIHG